MHKRILNCFASDFLKMSSFELLEAIAGSEGRVLAGECVSMTQPLGEDITNAEMVAAMGADLIILNIFGMRKKRDDQDLEETDRQTDRHQSGTGKDK